MSLQKPHGSSFRQPEPRRVVDMPAGSPQRRGAAAGPAAGTAPPAAPSAPPAADTMAPPRTDTTRKLQVGREITLTGEIGACDHLVVEGQIEAKLRDCHVIEIGDSGVFKGSAEVDLADIGGRFEGDLVVRSRLKVRGSGVVSGSVRYGELEVEVGGRLIGTLDPLEGAGPSASQTASSAAAPASAATDEPVAAVGGSGEPVA